MNFLSSNWALSYQFVDYKVDARRECKCDNNVCETIAQDIPETLPHAFKDCADTWVKSEEL